MNSKSTRYTFSKALAQTLVLPLAVTAGIFISSSAFAQGTDNSGNGFHDFTAEIFNESIPSNGVTKKWEESVTVQQLEMSDSAPYRAGARIVWVRNLRAFGEGFGNDRYHCEFHDGDVRSSDKSVRFFGATYNNSGKDGRCIIRAEVRISAGR